MLTEALRAAAANLDESDIVGVMNAARNRQGIVPLWVGEGDLPTPGFIMDAAKTSLDAGETFYTWQRGIPELREALAAYHARHFPVAHDPERYFVTGSGMQAIQLALQALAGHGDEVVMLTPCWPNIHAASQVAGAKPVHVSLDFSSNGWSLDLNRLADAITPQTRALFINSPANPSGFTASEDDLAAILDLAKRHNIWIIADEVYHRFVYDLTRFPKGRSPSFYDVAAPDDPVIYVNTMSKNWAMTGWRCGWIAAPPELGQVFENLIQYSTSGVAPFTQRAAATALNEGEDFITFQLERARENRETICAALEATGKVDLVRPDGAFYLFFKIDGMEDSKVAAMRIINEANVGLAPGTGFYTGGGPFLRLCFMRDPDQISEGASRLVDWLNKI